LFLVIGIVEILGCVKFFVYQPLNVFSTLLCHSLVLVDSLCTVPKAINVQKRSNCSLRFSFTVFIDEAAYDLWLLFFTKLKSLNKPGGVQKGLYKGLF
jgi:hypothetical protein